MWKWIPLALVAGVLHAAVIRGTVVENQTGRALASTAVRLEPVPGSPGQRMQVRCNRFGLFEFAAVPAGTYLLEASRAGFVTVQYGQKRWNSSGTPFALADSDAPFLTIRLPRFGSIAGMVVDENDVGRPEFDVAVYRNTRPPQYVTKATSDDRGQYRLYGLLPGNYLVRSLGKQYEDGAYKPTFARETEVVDQAYPVDVELDQQVNQVNVRPMPGQLYSLSVAAEPLDPPHKPVTLTLVSDMGRWTVQDAAHTFTGLPRGDYEIFAEAPADAPPAMQGNYQRLTLSRDLSIGLELHRAPDLLFQFDGVPLQAVTDGTVRVLGRRKDLAGSHGTQVLQLANRRAVLAAGPWEFALAPLPGYYVAGFSGPGPYRRNLRTEGWNETTVGGPGTVRFSLSSNAGSLHGVVSDSGNPAVGAPVFLEPTDLEPPRRVTDTYVTLTDTHGQYRFDGLAPGHYRVLSSFEYQMPDSRIMVSAGAKELQVDTRSDVSQDLSLYVIR